MREGKFPGRKDDDESPPPWDEISGQLPIIDNEGGLNFYTARQVSHWIGVTPTRVRQLAHSYNIGQKIGNLLTFTFGDIITMGRLTRKGRKPMRNVTPANDPDLMLKQLQGQDELKAIMKKYWDRLATDVRLFLHDHTESIYHQIDKVRAESQKEYHGMSYETMEIWNAIRLIEKHLGIDPRKPKKREEGIEGRGGANLGRSNTPSTLSHHEANAA